MPCGIILILLGLFSCGDNQSRLTEEKRIKDSIRLTDSLAILKYSPKLNWQIFKYIDEFGEIWLGAVKGESAPDKGDKSDYFFTLVEDYIYETTGKVVTIKTLKAKTYKTKYTSDRKENAGL